MADKRHTVLCPLACYRPAQCEEGALLHRHQHGLLHWPTKQQAPIRATLTKSFRKILVSMHYDEQRSSRMDECALLAVPRLPVRLRTLFCVVRSPGTQPSPDCVPSWHSCVFAHMLPFTQIQVQKHRYRAHTIPAPRQLPSRTIRTLHTSPLRRGAPGCHRSRKHSSREAASSTPAADDTVSDTPHFHTWKQEASLGQELRSDTPIRYIQSRCCRTAWAPLYTVDPRTRRTQCRSH